MKYNLSENIHKLTDEFIEKRIPATEVDKQLYAKYMEAVDAGEERLPVFKGTEGTDADYPVLTHYGFAKLSTDLVYMNHIYIPKIMGLYHKDLCHPLLRQRLIELCRAILSTGKSVCDIFPERDAMKVQSCINLFDSVSEIPELKEVKKKNHWIG